MDGLAAAPLRPDVGVYVLKWVLDAEAEPGHAAAARLLERWPARELELLVPSLWLYEVGNILSQEAGGCIRSSCALWDLGLIEVGLDRELIQRALSLSQRHRLTFYDASYLAVAEQRGVTLVTADSKFDRRLPAGLAVELLE
jgi:predicted nucleic acid-binding protein